MTVIADGAPDHDQNDPESQNWDLKGREQGIVKESLRLQVCLITVLSAGFGSARRRAMQPIRTGGTTVTSMPQAVQVMNPPVGRHSSSLMIGWHGGARGGKRAQRVRRRARPVHDAAE